MILSASPGYDQQITNDEWEQVSQIVNSVTQYRLGAYDFWDNWSESQAFSTVMQMIDFSVPIAGKMTGIATANGYSFADNDILPFGYITNQSYAIHGYNYTANGMPNAVLTSFTLAQQRSIFTMWCMFRSPLIYGGDLINPEPNSISIITNADLLFIHAYSQNLRVILWNQKYLLLQSEQQEAEEYYAVVVNVNNTESITGTIYTPNRQLCTIRDVWANKNYDGVNNYQYRVGLYESVVLRMTKCQTMMERSTIVTEEEVIYNPMSISLLFDLDSIQEQSSSSSIMMETKDEDHHNEGSIIIGQLDKPVISTE